MAVTASDVMVDRLLEWGVDTIFGLPGDGINGFMEALRTRHDRIRYVHVRHEEVGALAAVGYAKFTGRLAACFSTAAPGAIHMMNGLLDSRLEQAPILAISGMTYHDLIGTSYLQDFDTDHVCSNLAVFNERIMGPSHIVNMVDLACRAALTERGPSHLAFPIDFQAAEMGADARSERNLKGHTSESYQPPITVPERSLIERAADMLGGCSRIAILAGAGARGCRAELEEVAEKLAAPIVKAQLGKDCVPDDSPYTTGAVALVGTRPSQEALSGCDGLLIVGSSMPYIEFYPQPGQVKCVQIDDKPYRIGLRHPVDVGLAGDAKHTLRELLRFLPRKDDRSFLEQAQRGMEEWWRLMEERGTSTATPMRPQVPTWALSEALAPDAIVCGDSGTVTTWAARQIRIRQDQRFSFSGTNCSMAAALPYAIGAQAAFPGRQVVAYTGDGSLTMHMGDLATCVQHNLPVKLVVLRNDTLGLIKWEQMVFLGNAEYGVDLAPVDFVKVAEGMGWKAVRIDDPSRCGERMREALAMDGPVLIECVIDEHVPPMPAKVKKKQAENMASALAAGSPNRTRIGLTMGRQMMEEIDFEASPAGVVKRAVKRAIPGTEGNE
jgi:pyruvate dehydrogenase (quinone)/pyruvate oxidase